MRRRRSWVPSAGNSPRSATSSRVLVEQKGNVFELTGTDNLCAAAVRAAARGTAHLNPNGTASVALTIQRPDGIPVSVTASLNLATLSGTWSDNFNNTGTFISNPPAPAGSPRPIVIVGNYAINFNATGASDEGTDAFSFGLTLPTAPAAPTANVIVQGAAFTANCPGTLANPRAAPGHLCVYESFRSNVELFCIARTGPSYQCDVSDNTGSSFFITSAAAGQTLSAGRWVVAVP